jgi:16S rRNA (adenine1518-N6/adenine1519-N6)-dimethyltransferase
MKSPSSLLKQYGLHAKKSWGQCFLCDGTIVERIVEAASISEREPVVEIGAGLGVLTQSLAQKASKVWAIERDRDLIQVLRREFEENVKVQVLEANALTYDFSDFSSPVRVVGNLPYNISSPLIFHLLEHQKKILSATLMVQLEVAERLLAAPGGRQYGVPSVLCQQWAQKNYALRYPVPLFTLGHVLNRQ